MTLTKVVDQASILQGDRAKLKDLLRHRLTECGWRDQVRLLCRDAINQKGGSSVSVDQIVEEITPKSRALVPDALKKELLMKIKSSIEIQEGMEF